MKMNRPSILKISTGLEAVKPPSVFSHSNIARENGPVLNFSKTKEKYTFWSMFHSHVEPTYLTLLKVTNSLLVLSF